MFIFIYHNHYVSENKVQGSCERDVLDNEINCKEFHVSHSIYALFSTNNNFELLKSYFY